MARLLDAVTPLADLLARTPDPDATIASIRAACADGTTAVLRVTRDAASAAGIDARLITLAAARAGITATDDNTLSVAELSAIGGALEVLVDTRREPDVSLVFTVPVFLATAFDAFTSKTLVVRAERTAAVVSAVASAARSSLTIAAPFLASMAMESLVPQARRVLDSGGMVTVVTRALSPRSPEPAQANITAVDALRRAAVGRPGRLRVSSWEESGLGVHLKAVVADDTDAYLGSANLTGPGQVGHAEAGVRLPARLASPLAEWLGLLADALDGRRGVAAYR
jgi:phosphatidylserine/phosphatidylglycerophosphate/cardiolipin synthase-like enzyme